MKKLFGAAFAFLLTAQSAPPSAAVADLGWMSGHWVTADGATEEDWMAPRGGVMLGAGRSFTGDALREYEFLRVQAGADGVPVFWALYNGAPQVAFRLTRSGPDSATFDNPAHDYPQRFHYRREGATLIATISAIDGSNATSWTFRRR
jgi:hypothetical protein